MLLYLALDINNSNSFLLTLVNKYHRSSIPEDKTIGQQIPGHLGPDPTPVKVTGKTPPQPPRQ